MTIGATVLTIIVIDTSLLLALVVIARWLNHKLPKPPKPARSAEAVAVEIRGALDSGRLDAALERANRRNQRRVTP